MAIDISSIRKSWALVNLLALIIPVGQKAAGRKCDSEKTKRN